MVIILFLQGNLVGVGTHDGFIQVWDVAANKQVNHFVGHSDRVGALAWNGDILASGSRDEKILQWDVRNRGYFSTRCLLGHRQEASQITVTPQ